MTYTKGNARIGSKARAGAVVNGRYTYNHKHGDASATKVVRFNGKDYKVNANVIG